MRASCLLKPRPDGPHRTHTKTPLPVVAAFIRRTAPTGLPQPSPIPRRGMGCPLGRDCPGRPGLAGPFAGRWVSLNASCHPPHCVGDNAQVFSCPAQASSEGLTVLGTPVNLWMASTTARAEPSLVHKCSKSSWLFFFLVFHTLDSLGKNQQYIIFLVRLFCVFENCFLNQLEFRQMTTASPNWLVEMEVDTPWESVRWTD